jgi:hypothetical protein
MYLFFNQTFQFKRQSDVIKIWYDLWIRSNILNYLTDKRIPPRDVTTSQSKRRLVTSYISNQNSKQQDVNALCSKMSVPRRSWPQLQMIAITTKIIIKSTSLMGSMCSIYCFFECWIDIFGFSLVLIILIFNIVSLRKAGVNSKYNYWIKMTIKWKHILIHWVFTKFSIISEIIDWLNIFISEDYANNINYNQSLMMSDILRQSIISFVILDLLNPWFLSPVVPSSLAD